MEDNRHVKPENSEIETLNSIKAMAQGLMTLYNIEYERLKPCVEDIINNGVRTIKYIEQVLDKLLDIPTEPCYQLFIRLCDYVATFDKECAKDYLEVYKDIYGEDEKQYIKEYK